MPELNRRSALRLALAAGGTVLSAPVALRYARGETPEHTLRLAFADATTSPYHKLLDGFAEEVLNKTGGAIGIKIYGLGELGSQANILTGLQTGIIDLAAHTTGFIQTLFPKFALLDLPYLFPDATVANKVLGSPACGQLFNDMPAKGIYGLSWIHWGWRPVTTVERPVPTPADMRGLKIRLQPGAIYNAIYTTLGAIPVSIDGSEIYVAVSQRVVDATENPLTSLVAIKLYEVAKTVTTTDIVYNAGVVMASKRRLDSLTSAQQGVIRQAALNLSPKWLEAAGRFTDDATETLTKNGMKFVPADIEAYKAATRPVYDKFLPIIGAEQVEAVRQQVSDAK